jgi:putative ABC transport system ATP-binding protein
VTTAKTTLIEVIMPKTLKIDSLKKQYGGEKEAVTNAIDDISLEIENGEFVGIMGASGSGKTTLLNMIAAIDRPTAGQIYIDGTEISQMSEKELAAFRGDKIGFIFQDYNLIDTLTVYENIALPLSMQKVTPDVITEKVNELADTFGIDKVLNKFPYEISGGQRQRAACARAIIKNPKLILADEPTGALDSKSAAALMETLTEMNTRFASTILMVTHDAVTASYCGKVIFIEDGKIKNQIIRNGKNRREFFNEILDIISLWGTE